MFQHLFGSGRRKKAQHRQIVDALYEQIVAASRQPVFFSEWSAPDTPLGHFEMVALHMILVQRRLRDQGEAAFEVAQSLIDEFFSQLDDALRELGTGDMGVPKRMKNLARMFYGRSTSYANALDASNQDELAAALMRNIQPTAQEWPQARLLASYALAAGEMLAAQSVQQIVGGVIRFPDAAASDTQCA